MLPKLTDNVDHEGSEHHDPTPTPIRRWGLIVAVRFFLRVVVVSGAARAPFRGGSMRHLTVPRQVNTPTWSSLIGATKRTPALSHAN